MVGEIGEAGVQQEDEEIMVEKTKKVDKLELQKKKVNTSKMEKTTKLKETMKMDTLVEIGI